MQFIGCRRAVMHAMLDRLPGQAVDVAIGQHKLFFLVVHLLDQEKPHVEAFLQMCNGRCKPALHVHRVHGVVCEGITRPGARHAVGVSTYRNIGRQFADVLQFVLQRGNALLQPAA